MEQNLSTTVAEVVMHHVTNLMASNLDEVMQDYTEESVVFAPEATFHGLVEIRAMFQAAIDQAPDLPKSIVPIRQDIVGDVAYAVWTAAPYIKAGTDTFVIRDGKLLRRPF